MSHKGVGWVLKGIGGALDSIGRHCGIVIGMEKTGHCGELRGH